MTVFDWVLVSGGTLVAVCAVWSFCLEWSQRRRPVRDHQDRWQAPRRYHNGWGEPL